MALNSILGNMKNHNLCSSITVVFNSVLTQDRNVILSEVLTHVDMVYVMQMSFFRINPHITLQYKIHTISGFSYNSLSID